MPVPHSLPVIALNDVPSDTTKASKPIDLRGKRNVRIQVFADQAGAPTARIKLFATEDVSSAEKDIQAMEGESPAPAPVIAKYVPVTIPEACVHGEGYTPFADNTVAIEWDGSADLNIDINADSPFGYMYVLYEVDSGGDSESGVTVIVASE